MLLIFNPDIISSTDNDRTFYIFDQEYDTTTFNSAKLFDSNIYYTGSYLGDNIYTTGYVLVEDWTQSTEKVTCLLEELTESNTRTITISGYSSRFTSTDAIGGFEMTIYDLQDDESDDSDFYFASSENTNI